MEMIPEQLKGKIISPPSYVNPWDSVFEDKDVAAAVEWLKLKISHIGFLMN